MPKRVIPPVTPKPTYGAGGKPWKPPKVKEDNPIKLLLRDLKAVTERTRLGRAKKFVKGGYSSKAR
jgi:hypothetical protein